MLYDSYELKMQNIAKVKGKILKYKLLIIILTALLMVSLATISYMSGMITQDLSFVSSVSYGEELSLDAKVMFKDANYEFRNVGDSTWSNNQPILPGDYEVRVVSTRMFGLKSSGDPVMFTISPKTTDVSVFEQTLIYGEGFTFAADLEDGDYFVSGDVDYTDFVLETDITPVSESLVVYNKDGVNVSSAYFFEEITTKIEFIPRDVTIEVVGKSKVYDGTELTSDEYTINNLIAGHTELVEINGSILNNGTANNEIINAVIKSGDTDISHMYNIFKVNSTLNISKKDVTITSLSDSKVYDGIELFNLEFTNTDIIEGDVITVINKPTITYFGEVTNNLEVTILNFENVNNYNITYVNGTLSILKRDIEITTLEKEVVYDGSYINNKDGFTYDTDELMLDDEFVVADFSTIKYVGEANNELVLKVDNNGTDISASYNITYTYGKLIVLQRDVVVTTANYSEVYNDEPHFQKEHTVENIVSADQSRVINFTQVKNVSKVDNIIEIKIFFNELDITSSYNISYELNKIEILPRNISIVTNSDEKQYDGTPLTNNEWTYNNSILKLVDGHILQTFNSGTITDVDDDNTVGTTANTNLSYIITSAGMDVTNNYDVDVALGLLKILQREITIETESAKKNYDDTILVKNEENDYKVISEQTFIFDHTLKISITGEALNVVRDEEGNIIGVDNTWDSFTITSGLNDVKKNYNITVVYGKLTIYPRMISIEALSQEKIYDGETLALDKWKYIGIDPITEIVSGHRLEAVIKGSITDVGTEINFIEKALVFKGIVDVSYNYIIVLNNGTLTITHREIYLTTDSIKVEYDDIIHFKHSATYNLESLKVVDGQELRIVYTSSIRNVGIVNNAYSSAKVFFDEDEKTDNYKIFIDLGSLEVFARSIVVTTHSDTSFIYNGEIQHDERYTIDRLITGHDTFITDIIGEENVTSNGLNKYNISIIADSEIKDTNYDITYDHGLLVILKRTVVVKTDSDEKTYDGTPLVKDSWDYNESLYEFIGRHSFNINIIGTITDVLYDGDSVSSVSNIHNGYSIYETETGDNVIDNYNIIITNGTLKINKRLLDVKLYGQWKIYDGEELTSDTYYYANETTLADNETFFVEINGSITNVGKVDNLHNPTTIKVLKADESLSTSNYDITVKDSTLEVWYREITIKTGDDVKVYDGEELTSNVWNYFESENQLLTKFNHTLKIDIVGTITNVGKEYNITKIGTEVHVVNEDQTENTNYIVYVEFGELEITKRTISILAQSDEKIYDAEVLANNGWEYSVVDNIDYFDILSNHLAGVVVTNNSSIIDAGEVSNKILDFLIVDEETTNNYNIILLEGKLEVFKRSITITTKGAQKEYDGTILSNLDIDIEQFSTNRGLVSSHNCITVNFTTIFLVGKVLNSVKVNIYEEEKNVTSNYEIEYVCEEYLEITKKSITITTNGDTKEYDGTLLFDKTLDDSILAANDRFDIIFFTEIYSHTEGIENIVRFNIIGKFLSEDIDVTECYDIDYNYGIFIITKKLVVYQTQSDEQVYNGQDFFNKELVLDLVPTDRCTVISYTTVKYYTENPVDNIIEFDVTHREFGLVTDNYEFIYSYGQLQVHKKEVVIETGTKSFEYTGSAHKFESCVMLDENGEEFELYDEYSIMYINSVTYVSDGDVENDIVYEIEAEARESYNVTVDKGILKILPLEITITVTEKDKIYDTTPLTSSEFKLDRELEGIEVIIQTNGTITNVGTVDNEIIDVKMIGADINNYTFIYVNSTLKITPYEIILETGSASKEYDGTPLTNDVSSYNPLFGTDEISYSVTGTITDVGVEANGVSAIVFISGNANNYEIRYELGNLIILEKMVYIYTADLDVIYTDFAYKAESYEAFDANNNSLPNFEIELNYLNSVTNVNLVGVPNEAEIVSLEGYNNFSIIIIPGIMIVRHREVIIKTLTNEEMEYNGEEQSYFEYEVIGDYDILDTHIARPSYIKTVKNYDGISYDNYFELYPYKIVEGEEIDVYENYIITVDEVGKIKILKRLLHVSADGDVAKVEYNGTEQGISPESLTYSNRVEFHDIVVTTDKGALLPGTRVEVEYSIKIFDGIEEVSNNYIISYDDCYLEIVKVELVYKSSSITALYNGIEHYVNTVDTIRGSIAECDEMLLVNSRREVEIGIYDNTFDDIYVYTPYLELYGFGFYDLYNVTFEDYGTIEITKVGLHIITNSIEQEYDGNSHSTLEWLYGEFSTHLLDGHYLNLYKTPTVKDVMYGDSGEIIGIQNIPEKISITDGQNNDVSDYYNLTVDYGWLQILPKTVNVFILNLKKTYESTLDYEIIHNDYKYYRLIDSSELLGNELILNVIESGESARIELDSFKVYSFEDDLTLNFTISSSGGAIEYTKRQLELIAGSVTTEYTGDLVFTQEYTLKGDSLMDGHVIKVVIQGYGLKVGVTPTQITSISIKDKDGNELVTIDEYGKFVSDYYEFKTVNGYITIT